MMSEPQNILKEKFAKQILHFVEHNGRRYYIGFRPSDIPEVAKFVFKELGCRLVTASGLDTTEGIEILYHFSHDQTGKMLTLKTLLTDKDEPHIESITPFIKAAEWIEREIWEMLGVHFDHHPNLKRLLLAEDLPEDFHPLRHSSSEG